MREMALKERVLTAAGHGELMRTGATAMVCLGGADNHDCVISNVVLTLVNQRIKLMSWLDMRSYCPLGMFLIS